MSPPTDEPAGTEPARLPFDLGLLVFFSSAVTLFVEMLEPKLFQFLKVFGHDLSVVAVALLGLGTAGLVSVVIGDRRRPALAAAAILLGPSVVFSFFILVKVQHLVPAALACSLPYFCAGLICGLSYLQASSWRVYGLSLLGSGLGILAVHLGLPVLGAEGGMLAAGAVAAFFGLAAAYSFSRRWSSSWCAAGGLGVLLCGAVLGLHLATGRFDLLKLAPVHARAGQMEESAHLTTSALRLPGALRLESRWSAISRVDALELPTLDMAALTYPKGTAWFENPRVKAEIQESFGSHLHLYSNNVWFSSVPDQVPLKTFLLPYTLVHHPRVLVIGVGGGIDLARALSREPTRLVGVEINPAVVELLKGPLAQASHHVYDRAEIRVMDGRSYVHFAREQFDLINLVFADLYIPFHFSNIFLESYLYTAEAFQDYLRLLAPDGYLCVTKMVGSLQTPSEILRISATALEAARRAGIPHPERNILVAGFSSKKEDAYGGTMLLKRTPFTEAELAEVRAELAPPLFPLYLPGEPGLDNPFSRLLTAPDPAAFYAAYPLNVTPPTDDKPFFYLFDKSFRMHREMTALFLALTLVVFWIPFAVLFRRQGYRKADGFRFTAYFIFLEAGYIFIETALVQKLNLYLGGPLYSLSVVVAAILIYPGLLGLLAEGRPRLKSRQALVLAPLSLLLLEPLLVRLIPHLPMLSPGPRSLLVFLLLGPFCLPLGIPFPLALEQIKSRLGSPAVGLFYGVSSTLGVSMVTLSLYASARFGIQALYLTGALAYGLVWLISLIWIKPQAGA